MSALLYRLGRASYRARGRVVAAWTLLLGVLIASAVMWGKPEVEGFSIPGTEAQQAMDELQEAMPEMSGASGHVVVVSAGESGVSAPEAMTAIETAAGQLESVEGVLSVSPEALSDDGTAVLLGVRFAGSVEEVPDGAAPEVMQIATALEADLPQGSQVAIGGDAFGAIEVPHDNLGEAIGIGLAFLVLFVTFGSFVAAGLPLIAALVVVGVTLTGISAVTALTDVSSTAPVLATMLGLALGIDYALFVLFRHVRQLREGMPAEESAARAVATAGSAVVFAGVTVVIALVGLAIVDIPFLTAMGLAAAVAVVLAVVSALTLVPALLGYTRRWVGARAAKQTEKAHARHEAPSRATRVFGRWVDLATAKPWVTIVLVVAAIGALSAPALGLRLGLPDAGSQPEDTSARQAYDLTAEHFGTGQNGPLLLTGTLTEQSDPTAFVEGLGQELLGFDTVADVPLAGTDAGGSTAIISVIPTSGPDSAETAALVDDIRAWAAELADQSGVSLAVTGQTAAGIDVSTLLSDALLPYIAFVVVLSIVLLAMVFRSIWVPIKATAGFLLTIGAALGSVALVYSWGWFSGPLGVEPTGVVISFMPIIVLGVLFGLAMDYEVFLVSAMREEYVHGATPRAAVRAGFLRSAPIVTAAALIMFVVFATFVPAADSTIKPIAIALAVGVAVDAFVVRMTLVPAVMTLLDGRAWGLPRFLERILPSFDVEGEGLARRLGTATPEVARETVDA